MHIVVSFRDQALSRYAARLESLADGEGRGVLAQALNEGGRAVRQATVAAETAQTGLPGDTLERALDVENLVKKLMAPNPARDAVVARAKELMDKELIAMGDEITKHPEVGSRRIMKHRVRNLLRAGDDDALLLYCGRPLCKRPQHAHVLNPKHHLRNDLLLVQQYLHKVVQRLQCKLVGYKQ